MKILMVSLWYRPHVGGVVETMHNLALGLRDKGHETVFLIEGPENKISLIGYDGQSPVYSFRIRDIESRNLLSMATAAIMCPLTIRRLSVFLKEHDFDIVNIQFPTPRHAHFLPLRNRWYKKLVVSVHGSDVRLGLSTRSLGRKLTSRLIQKADGLVACSQYLLDRTIESVGQTNGVTARVIYGGAKSNWTEREVVDPCLKGKYFLAVGSLIDVKGMDILIRAMARLGDKYNEYNLRIVGNGELRGHLEKTVVELGLKERVVFSGELNHQSLIKLYEESLFCVIPSRSEGLSLVALESQAACKAVIASKVGGLPELIKDNVNGLLFEVGNEEQLSQRISYLIDNPDLAAAMGREGRSQVSKDFNWERNTEEYCNLFDELIGQ